MTFIIQFVIFVALSWSITSHFKETLAVLACGFVVIVAYYKWSFGYWDRKGVTAPKATFPLGNAVDLITGKSSLGKVITDIYNNYKAKGLKYCGYFIFSDPLIILFDPEMIKTVRKDCLHFSDMDLNDKNDTLTVSFYDLMNPRWRQLFPKLTPTFTSGKIEIMFQILLDYSKELISIINNLDDREEPIDIKKIINKFKKDTFETCAFGTECNNLKNYNMEITQAEKEIVINNKFAGLVAETLSENHPTTAKLVETVLSATNFDEIKSEGHKAVGKTEQSTNNTAKTMDELSELRAAKELTEQAFILFLGGFEYSSTTFIFCLYELVCNTLIQDKVRDEINVILEKHRGKITYKAIMEMKYMDKCISETLRKYPSAPVIVRKCKQNFKLPGSNVVIDKGIKVLIPVLGILHDSEYYAESERFYPERYSSQFPANTWLPFEEGPAFSTGFKFGMMQTKFLLTVLLKKFRFTLNEKTQQPLKMEPKGFFLAVNSLLWVNVEPVSKLRLLSKSIMRTVNNLDAAPETSNAYSSPERKKQYKVKLIINS